MKGMIVYAFAWRKVGHSPCNVRIARAAKRISQAQNEPVMIFAQRTTAAILRELGVECHTMPKASGYEGSEQPTHAAAEVFRQNGITEVIPVAQPFLQIVKCLQLVRAEGFKTLPLLKLIKLIGWIGFDKLSMQPWTRGPIRLVVYTARQMLLGYKPPAELSE